MRHALHSVVDRTGCEKSFEASIFLRFASPTPDARRCQVVGMWLGAETGGSPPDQNVSRRGAGWLLVAHSARAELRLRSAKTERNANRQSGILVAV